MPFDPKSAKKAGKKSKRGPAKKEGPSIKEKMEMLYEKVLDDLLINQDKLTKTERVKVFVTLSNYIFPKTKSVRDQFTIEQLKEIDKQGFLDRDPDPAKHYAHSFPNVRYRSKKICETINLLILIALNSLYLQETSNIDLHSI